MAYINTSQRLLILPLHQTCQMWVGSWNQRLWEWESCIGGSFQEAVSASRSQNQSVSEVQLKVCECLTANEAWCVEGSGCCVGSGCDKVRKQKPENRERQENINREGFQPRDCQSQFWCAVLLNAITAFIKITLWGSKMFRAVREPSTTPH